jgi:hypothetical protein
VAGIRPRSCRQRHHDRVQRPDGIFRIELDLQSALPAVQIDAGFLQRRRLDGDRDALLLRERADAADMISAQPFLGSRHKCNTC